MKMSDAGFTFIELLVALGVFILIVAILLPVAVGFYLSYQFNSESQLAVSIIEHARNRAFSNINESDHGVYITSDEYILFQGDNYDNRDQSEDQGFPRADNVVVTGADEVVFSALSGRAASTTIIFTDDHRQATIHINEEGRIEF